MPRDADILFCAAEATFCSTTADLTVPFCISEERWRRYIVRETVFSRRAGRGFTVFMIAAGIMISEEENFLEISLLRWEAPYTTTPVVSGMT